MLLSGKRFGLVCGSPSGLSDTNRHLMFLFWAKIASFIEFNPKRYSMCGDAREFFEKKRFENCKNDLENFLEIIQNIAQFNSF